MSFSSIRFIWTGKSCGPASNRSRTPGAVLQAPSMTFSIGLSGQGWSEPRRNSDGARKRTKGPETGGRPAASFRARRSRPAGTAGSDHSLPLNPLIRGWERRPPRRSGITEASCGRLSSANGGSRAGACSAAAPSTGGGTSSHSWVKSGRQDRTAVATRSSGPSPSARAGPQASVAADVLLPGAVRGQPVRDEPEGEGKVGLEDLLAVCLGHLAVSAAVQAELDQSGLARRGVDDPVRRDAELGVLPPLGVVVPDDALRGDDLHREQRRPGEVRAFRVLGPDHRQVRDAVVGAVGIEVDPWSGEEFMFLLDSEFQEEPQACLYTRV